MPTPRRRERNEALLIHLLHDVNRARANIRLNRGVRGGPTTGQASTQLCSELADAMHAYADAASESGVPLPYRYRDEMRLYDAMGGR